MFNFSLYKADNAEGANPIAAIGLAIVVALAMVMTTFTIFLQSSSYTTVKQIQAGTKIARAFKVGDIDTKSPIKADDITAYERTVQQRLKMLDDQSDFNKDVVGDQRLEIQP